MGLEAKCVADVGSQSALVHALLESDELILRGAIRRRFPRSAITNVGSSAAGLSFDYGGDHTARSWRATCGALSVAVIKASTQLEGQARAQSSFKGLRDRHVS